MSSTRRRRTRRVTLLGAAANVLLASVKAVAGVLGGSPALVADAIHSLSDLFGDGVVLVSSRLAARPADSEHPYGYGRLETIGTLLLGLLIVVTGAGVAVDALGRFGSDRVPASVAMWVSGGAIVVKELLYHVTARVGREVRSPIVLANAWHHRSDALSSVTALVGIIGARMGAPILDPIAAILVAVLIAGTGVRFARAACRELTDRMPPARLVEEVADGVATLPGVRGVHRLRARRMGSEVVVDLHVEVAGRTTVSDGHQVAERVRRYILRHDSVSDVLVHVDSEADEPEDASVLHPPREEIERAAREVAASVPEIDRVTCVLVHFLGGRVIVDMHVGVDVEMHVREAMAVAEDLRRRLEASAHVDRADVCLQLTSEPPARGGARSRSDQ